MMMIMVKDAFIVLDTQIQRSSWQEFLGFAVNSVSYLNQCNRFVIKFFGNTEMNLTLFLIIYKQIISVFNWDCWSFIRICLYLKPYIPESQLFILFSQNLFVLVTSLMPSTPIKSCNKYVLSYKDSFNNTHQVGFYARDAYNCLMLAREFNSYVHDHPGSVIRIQQKF